MSTTPQQQFAPNLTTSSAGCAPSLRSRWHTWRLCVVGVCALAVSSCAASQVHVKGVRAAPPVDVAVQIEPFSETVGTISADGLGLTQVRPFFVRKDIMDSMQLRVRGAFGSQVSSDDLYLAKTTITNVSLVDNNAAMHGALCGFGLLCPPLWIVHLMTPYRTVLSIHVVVQVFHLTAEEARARRRSVDGKTEPEINTEGLVAVGTDEVFSVENEVGALDFSNDERRVWEPTADAIAAIIRRTLARAAQANANQAQDAAQ